MVLEISALMLVAILLWFNRQQRVREPMLWRLWLALLRGEHHGLDDYEAHLARELETMVTVGHDVGRAQAAGDSFRVRIALEELLEALDTWSLNLTRHLFLSLAWWATLRATLEVQPLDATALQVGRLRALARTEAALLLLLPRTLWLEWHVRVLGLALRLLPGVFRGLTPSAGGTAVGPAAGGRGRPGQRGSRGAAHRAPPARQPQDDSRLKRIPSALRQGVARNLSAAGERSPAGTKEAPCFSTWMWVKGWITSDLGSTFPPPEPTPR